MKRFPSSLVVLAFLLVNSLGTGDEKTGETKNPYDEMFSFPAKVTLDAEQTEKLAELRKMYEKRISDLDKALKGATGADALWYAGVTRSRDKLARVAVRKKNAILTDEQRKTLGIKDAIPFIVSEKALSDPKVWDVGQLEKVFTIQSRSYDPIENEVSFMVITSKKWTDPEKSLDASAWQGLWGREQAPVKVIFYNKNDEATSTLTGPYAFPGRGRLVADSGVTRVPTRLTDKEQEEGLLRYRIKIDLDHGQRFGLILKDITSAKVVYAPKELK